MRFVLDVLPAAIADIVEAPRWYEDQHEGLGAEFTFEINRTIDSLAEQALLFRVRYRRKNVRWTFPRRFPYRICYYVEAQTVQQIEAGEVSPVLHDEMMARLRR
jgi:plasmid stabilization system protein ParE